MAIIPFGLVGTIWGHQAWGIPLSMFTVVGLIGMTGILINDSIVLVSTVDEYAEDRDITQAIIDGAVDRLRPVLLTTLTTVLGLMPLLFETSRQAQFLKPTVITLSYGLGFGLVLVLLLVPSLLAMQRDLRLRANALRRMIAGRRAIWPQRLVLAGAGLAIAGVFAATLGPLVVTGAPWAPVASWLPETLPAGLGAFALFALASAVICGVAAALAAFLFALARRARAA